MLYPKGEQKMKLRWLYIALACSTLVLLLVACAQDTPEPEIEETRTVTTSPLSPTATTGQVQSPVPTPVSEEVTPGPDTGVVRGLLLMNGEPTSGRTLYLAGVISSAEEMEVAALDPVNDPRAEADTSGTFVFVDVPPGRYALGIDSPVGPVLIRGEDGDEIEAIVEAGQVTDLGPVRIVPFDQ
jgi:hypothetical protein